MPLGHYIPDYENFSDEDIIDALQEYFKEEEDRKRMKEAQEISL